MTTIELIRAVRKEIANVAARGQAAITFVDLDRYFAVLENTPSAGSSTSEQLKFAEFQHQSSLEMFRSVIATGQSALKASLLINGGASVALLAFVGHLIATPVATNLVSRFACPLMLFVTGILSAAVASGATYIGQTFYHHNRPKLADVVRILTILLVTGSYFTFALGCYHTYKIFHSISLLS